MSDQIDNHARDLASMLDRGQGARVAEILRNDLYSMNECDFSKLVHATNKYEKDGYGDDITINPYREKGGPKEHVSVELNRRDKDGLPIVYSETIQSWGNWPGQRPQVSDQSQLPKPKQESVTWHQDQARHQETQGWDPYESSMQRSSFHNTGFQNPFLNRYQDYRSQDYRNQDYRYQRPYQEFQPYQSRRESFRPEDIILPAILGIGLGAAFSLGRQQNQYQNFQPRQHFYPQSYNSAPNFYDHHHSHNHHRRYW